jgi:peroxiredoxin
MRLRVLPLLLLLVMGACIKTESIEPRPAPPFDLADLAGGRLTLESLKGSVIILDFWATWCGPCIAEIPEYAELWRKNKSRGVEVIGVVFESGDPQEIADFVREQRIPYRQLLGDDRLLKAFGANQGFPTTFLIDRQGVIQSRFLGSTPKKFEKMQETVERLLAAP